MKILFEQKKPGRLRQTVAPVEFDILLEEPTVSGLISASVASCVERYNNSLTQTAEDFDRDTYHNVLTEREIEDLAETGRVSFGIRFEGKPVDMTEAVANALQCYEDGLFRMFLNGATLGDLKDAVEIKEGDTLTVVRLTMLAGRMW